MTDRAERRFGLHRKIHHIRQARIRQIARIFGRSETAKALQPVRRLYERYPYQPAAAFGCASPQCFHRPKGTQIAGDIVQALCREMERRLSPALAVLVYKAGAALYDAVEPAFMLPETRLTKSA